MPFDVANFASVIQSAHLKVPLPELNAKLKELNLPSAGSWIRLAKTLVEYANTADGKKQTNDFEDLVLWIGSYSLYSNKVLSLHSFGKVSSVTMGKFSDALRKALPSLNVSLTHPAGKFPIMAVGAQLLGTSGRTVFREYRKTPNGDEFVFSHFREYQFREEVPVTKGDSQAVPKLSPYYKIVGFKRVVHEHVDLVRVSSSALGPGIGSVEVFIDATKPGGALLSHDEIKAHLSIYTAIVGSVSQSIFGTDLPAARNLYGSMPKIYNSHDGNICELYFTTAIGGSVKREKMKRNTADLRNETWHAGGRNAIASAAVPDTIEIYRLSVSWKVAFSSDEPVLSILGTYRALTDGLVTQALIAGCTEEASFNFALSKLVKYS